MENNPDLYILNEYPKAYGPPGIYMVWTHDRGEVYVYACESLLGALWKASTANLSSEIVDRIEGPSGNVPLKGMWEWIYRSPMAVDQPKPVHRVMILNDETDIWAAAESFTDIGEAQSRADRMSEHIPGRVKVTTDSTG